MFVFLGLMVTVSNLPESADLVDCSAMLLLVLALLLQGPPSDVTVSTLPDRQMTAHRVSGKTTSGPSEPVQVEITLKGSLNEVIGMTRSFANGSFSLNIPRLGQYWLSITDPRFSFLEIPLLLREPKDTSRPILINLQPNRRTSEAFTVDLSRLSGTVPANALNEFRKGREATKNAESHFKKAIELAPTFYEAHVELALAEERRKRPQEAIRAITRAAELRPSDPMPLRVLGRLYIESSQFQKGVDTLFRIGPIGQLDAEDRFFLGIALYKLDKPAAAQQQYETSISLAPGKNPDAYLQLHNAFMKQDEPVKALTVLEQYIQLFPADTRNKEMSDRAHKLRATLAPVDDDRFLDLEFVKVQPGDFMMGCPENVVACDDDERPAHRVRLTKEFEIGKYEVTQALWVRIMGSNPSGSKGEDLPVDTVSWDDVQIFLQRLNSKQDGFLYRLPTEAEWEYAARAGTTGAPVLRTEATGIVDSSSLEARAWFDRNSGGKSHPVGQRQPNAWGIYDMEGNVWEWVQDWYDPSYYRQSPSENPTGPAQGQLIGTRVSRSAVRVQRGGSWSNIAPFARPSARSGTNPSVRDPLCGLRLVREATR